MRPGPVDLVLLALLLAGCTQANPAPATTAPGVIETSPEIGSSSLEGRIIDDEGLPVEGAMAKLAARATPAEPVAQATSAIDGTFRMPGLQDGAYILSAEKIGYKPVPPKAVDLVAGETTEVTVTLEPTAMPTPAHYSKSMKFGTDNAIRIGTAYSMTGICGTCSNPTPLKYANTEPTLGEVSAFLVEMRWTPTQSVCDSPMRSDVFSPQHASFADRFSPKNPYHWDNLPAATSPTRLLVPRTGEDPKAMLSPQRTEWNEGQPIEIEGEWQFDVEATTVRPLVAEQGVSCYVQHTAELWMTAFHLGMPPEKDWTVFKA